MACSCALEPCVCGGLAGTLPYKYPKTKCDLYVKGDKNVWWEKWDESATGICLLDTMTCHQVAAILERDEKARQDLLAITTDEELTWLAHSIKRLPTSEDSDALMRSLGQTKNDSSVPFYSLFRGQPPENR